jgi:nucleotide-binding universal stress UspA family protein
LKKILVLTDFSPSAKNAGVYACALAKQFKAKVVLFHAFALPIPSTDMPIVAISVPDMEKDNLKTLKKESELIRKKSNVKIEIQTRAGFAVDEAIQLEKKLKPDLIVAGMKGKSNAERMLVGSIVTDVIRRAKTPVLVIPEKAKFNLPK